MIQCVSSSNAIISCHRQFQARSQAKAVPYRRTDGQQIEMDAHRMSFREGFVLRLHLVANLGIIVLPAVPSL